MWGEHKSARTGSCFHLIHFENEEEANDFYSGFETVKSQMVYEEDIDEIDNIIKTMKSRQDNKYSIDGVWQTTMLFSSEINHFIQATFLSMLVVSKQNELIFKLDELCCRQDNLITRQDEIIASLNNKT